MQDLTLGYWFRAPSPGLLPEASLRPNAAQTPQRLGPIFRPSPDKATRQIPGLSTLSPSSVRRYEAQGHVRSRPRSQETGGRLGPCIPSQRLTPSQAWGMERVKDSGL